MNPVIVTIGSYSLRWYSVFIMAGVFIAYFVMNKEAKRLIINRDFLFNMFFWALIFGIIGARAYYVLFNWSLYADDLLSILKFWEGGLAIHGGIIAGVITMLVYCKRYNVRLIRMTDLVAPSLLIAQAIGRWGNFFNGEAHGAATTLLNLQDKFIPRFIINGMNINGIYYEPTFFYESIWCFVGFVIILFIRRRKYLHIGNLTAFYLMWYSAGRFFIEGMRTDSLMLGGFRMAQIVSVLMFLFGLGITMLLSRKAKFDDLYNSEENQEIKF